MDTFNCRSSLINVQLVNQLASELKLFESRVLTASKQASLHGNLMDSVLQGKHVQRKLITTHISVSALQLFCGCKFVF